MPLIINILGETKEARVLRYAIHQAHLLCLVAVASRANFALCSNELDLQAIVISALSMDIEIRNTGKFYTRITKLCIAWRESFRVKDFDYDEASDQYSNEYAKYFEKQVEEKEISCTSSPDSNALYINHQLSVMGFIAWMRRFLLVYSYLLVWAIAVVLLHPYIQHH